MPTIGQSITKPDLLQRAKDNETKAAADPTVIWKRSNKEETDLFIKRLEDAPDGTLAEMKANALKQSASLKRTANIAQWGSYGLLATAFFAPVPQPVKLAVLVGACAAVFVSNTYDAKAGIQRSFAAQLGEFQTSIDATSNQPAPAPAPEQPAPAPAPQQPTAA